MGFTTLGTVTLLEPSSAVWSLGRSCSAKSMLQSGSIDFAEQLRPSDQASLKGSGSYTVPTLKHPIEFLDLATVTTQRPFDQLALRQALRKAIPYAQIMKQVYSGRAIAAQGLINPTTKGYTTAGLKKGSYDPSASKKILLSAGITKPVSFTLHVSNTVPDAVDAATLIKSYAKKAGFNVTVQQDPSAAFATGRGSGTFQALIYRTRAQTQSPVYNDCVVVPPEQQLRQRAAVGRPGILQACG